MGIGNRLQGALGHLEHVRAAVCFAEWGHRAHDIDGVPQGVGVGKRTGMDAGIDADGHRGSKKRGGLKLVPARTPAYTPHGLGECLEVNRRQRDADRYRAHETSISARGGG